MDKNKIKNLIVDTSAFIKGAQLQEIAENIITIQEVIDEVTSKKQLRNLVVLPYDLVVKNVFTENIKFISEFAKKTGDYTSLSATDIKVMALTYQVEKELIGTEHLKEEPTTQKTIKVSGITPKNIEAENPLETHQTDSPSGVPKPSDELTEQLEGLDLEQNIGDVLVKSEDHLDAENTSSEDDSGSDGGEWITPENVREKKKEMNFGDCFEDKSVEVACITTDFAMQNVLKQIGLNITSIDGKIIRQVRTFIFRCTTCFKTTSNMTKTFCPKCGHATLKKVAVSIDEDGNQQIHINGRKPLTSRGKRFSLPTPRGGQHFQYPIITEDQHIHKRQATRLARAKNNPLDPDYTASLSPFTVRDVNSKSAVLGVRNRNQDMKQQVKINEIAYKNKK